MNKRTFLFLFKRLTIRAIFLPCNFAVLFFVRNARVLFVLLVVTGCFSFVSAQGFADTIRLKEVFIQTSRLAANYSGDYKSDSIVKMNFQEATVSELISKIAPVGIKNYGSGSLSTFSFRGYTSSQSSVMWNGLSIKSPLNGSADLSQLPASFFDEASVSLGAQNARESSSSAVALCLDNKPKWGNGLSIDGSAMYNALNNSVFNLKASNSNDKWFYVLRSYYQFGKNQFSYVNYLNDSHNKIETSSPLWLFGLMNEIYRKSNNGVQFSLKSWYSKGDRFLSPVMGKSDSNERQYDEALRVSADVNVIKSKYIFNLTLSIADEMLRYKNESSGIDSRHESFNQVVSAKYARSLGKLRMRSGGGVGVCNAKSDDFNGKRYQNNYWLFIDAEYPFSERFSFISSVREDLAGELVSPILPLIGARFQVFKNRQYFLKGNISRKFHAPSLNDLYWHPGGNPDLKPEQILQSEIALETPQFQISKKNTIEGEVLVYKGYTKNLIQWTPEESGLWKAQNVRNVESTGLELRLFNNYSFKNGILKIGGVYSFNQVLNMTQTGAVDLSYKKQLIYMPKHSVQGSADFRYRNNSVSLYYNRSGRRYISTDNDWYLPAYQIFDLVLSRKVTFEKFGANFQFKIDNIFNKEYQSIAFKPLPGRVYSIVFRIGFAEKKL